MGAAAQQYQIMKVFEVSVVSSNHDPIPFDGIGELKRVTLPESADLCWQCDVMPCFPQSLTKMMRRNIFVDI